MASQGFRKYLTQARDHEELLAFLLGQIVKEKTRYYQLQKHSQPESITVPVAELEERVSFPDIFRPRAPTLIADAAGQGA